MLLPSEKSWEFDKEKVNDVFLKVCPAQQKIKMGLNGSMPRSSCCLPDFDFYESCFIHKGKKVNPLSCCSARILQLVHDYSFGKSIFKHHRFFQDNKMLQIGFTCHSCVENIWSIKMKSGFTVDENR